MSESRGEIYTAEPQPPSDRRKMTCSRKIYMKLATVALGLGKDSLIMMKLRCEFGDSRSDSPYQTAEPWTPDGTLIPRPPSEECTRSACAVPTAAVYSPAGKSFPHIRPHPTLNPTTHQPPATTKHNARRCLPRRPRPPVWRDERHLHLQADDYRCAFGTIARSV